MIKISPSILSADFANLREDIDQIKDYAEYIHIDVMDGVFVDNISIGIPVVRDLRKHFKNVFDVHLMIVNPLKYIKEFAKAGADILTFHYETGNVIETINEIKKYNVRAGISIKPETKVEVLLDILPLVDLVLIMSVNPGFGGQEFINTATDKISFLAKVKKEKNLDFEIEVDGGINDETAKEVRMAGVDVVVAGSYIFKAVNKVEAIRKLKE